METPNNNQDNTPAVRVYEATPASATSGEPIAERFVQKELTDARKSFRVTQIVASVLALGTMMYTGFIASELNKTLEPTAAANVATGLIATQVDEQGPQIAAEIRQRIPKLIEEVPDYAIKQLPQYRTALESQVENDMSRYFTSSSKELGASFDELLEDNKASISQMLKDGKDAEATKLVGDAMEKEMLEYAGTVQINGETLSTKLDGAYTSLTQVDKRMAKLAANKNLTPQEKKARRAIGILSRTIDAANPAVTGGKTI
ncbi:MAG: hypothetical protein H8F28_14320 [Fibrella sp.]|nr:hypothetical protein [Armatimonadota bacterium]